MQLLHSLLDLIFPERIDHRIVRELEAGGLLCHLSAVALGSFTALLPFKEPTVRSTIHEAKFHHNEKAWQLLSEVLSQYLKHLPAGTVLIPVPLSDKRLKERGYNQVTKVAKLALRSVPHIKLLEDRLERVRDTVPQTKLKREERLTNVTGAFGARDLSALTNVSVIILDDVATTGATLKAAEASLLPLKPSSITLLALAH